MLIFLQLVSARRVQFFEKIKEEPSHRDAEDVELEVVMTKTFNPTNIPFYWNVSGYFEIFTAPTYLKAILNV